MKSIKAKLVLATAGLIILILGVASFLLIRQKQTELTNDLFSNTKAFAELTANDVVGFHELYLAQNSFVYFNREIEEVFQKNPDVKTIKIIRYSGEVLYDSNVEREEQYEGDARTASGDLARQIKSQFESVATLDAGRVLFMKRDEDGEVVFVDENEKPIQPLEDQERVRNFVIPVDDAFAVEYQVSYERLNERIAQMQMNIVLLAAVAIAIGVALSWLLAGGITKPIRMVTEGAKKIALGDFKTRIQVSSADETKVLASTFNQMAQTLDVTTKAIVYEERVRKELELAAKIQKDILPKEVPKVLGLDVSAGLIPAEEIGGDCYDFIEVADGKWIFYLGDVTGHGVPSGIVVSIANAMFAAADQTDPKEILSKVNRVLKQKTTPNMFITLVLLQWDEKTQTMTYVSAGHEPVLVYRAALGKVETLPPGGIAMGMVSEIGDKLTVNQVKMDTGDFIVAYSDGVPEAWRSEKEMYGMERFEKIVHDAKDLQSSIAIRNAIFADVKEFTGEYKQMDDITVMVIKKT